MTTPSAVLLPPAGQRILFILAHPDDAEFLCGGTVSLLAQEGRDLHYLLVTRGEKGSDDPTMTPERLATIREAEQRRAAQAHGVGIVTFLDGFVDGEVVPSLQLRAALVRVIRSWRPDAIFTFDPWHHDELHPDHRAVGICALDAIASARGRLYFPEQIREGLAPHHVRDVYYFSTDRPNHWVDITAVVEQKIAALRCHESQMLNFDPADYVYRKGRIAGVEHKYRFAEAFHHVRI